MFVTLGRFLNQLADRETKRYGMQLWRDAGSPRPYNMPAKSRGFRSGFIVGFLERLQERFDEEVRPKAVSVQRTATVQTIVLLCRDALDQVRAWMKEHMNLQHCSHVWMGNPLNGAGRRCGHDAANEVNLRPNPVGIGANRRQLR